MDALTLATSLVLAAVFGIAGIAKLRDLEGTRTAVRAFGGPEPLVPVIAVVLPFAELAVAGALLLPTARAVGAAGALGLLTLFSVVIAASLARGKTPECHCFGQSSFRACELEDLGTQRSARLDCRGPSRCDA